MTQAPHERHDKLGNLYSFILNHDLGLESTVFSLQAKYGGSFSGFG
jgi:hypothetical protein